MKHMIDRTCRYWTMRMLMPVIIIAGICVIVSCGHDNVIEAELVSVDSLIYEDADSAAVVLAKMKPRMTDASEAARNYYNLLMVKTDDKTKHTHSSDSLICAVAEYYEQQGDRHLLPEAYYYVGRVNSSCHNGEKALLYFQRALCEDSTQVSPYLKSRIYAQMGVIYLRNNLYDEAINMDNLSYYYCKQIGDTTSMRYCEENVRAIRNLASKADSVDNSDRALVLQNVNSKFKSQYLAKRNNELQEKNTETRHLILVIVVCVVAVIAFVWYLLQRRKAKLASTPDASVATTEHASAVSRQFYDADVNQLLTTHISDDKVLKPSEWKMVEARLLDSFPDFREKLFSLYNLSETEYRICMLIKLGISPTNIAKLTATGKSSVSQSRLRMQQKVFNGEGTAQDWDNFIMSI